MKPTMYFKPGKLYQVVNPNDSRGLRPVHARIVTEGPRFMCAVKLPANSWVLVVRNLEIGAYCLYEEQIIYLSNTQMNLETER